MGLNHRHVYTLGIQGSSSCFVMEGEIPIILMESLRHREVKKPS